MEARRNNRILELDGLRAFAVGCVVFYHEAIFSGLVPVNQVWIRNALEAIGTSGVNVFFIISGFIITTLLLRERERTGSVSLKAFYIRRIFRIIPPFAAYLCVVRILCAYGVIVVSNRNFMAGALLLGNTGIFDHHAWFVGHTWSLAVEEQFYLIFPPLLCLVFRFRRQPISWALGALYLVCLCSQKIGHELYLHINPSLLNVAALYEFRYIIVGVLIALHHRAVFAFLSGKPPILPWMLGLTMFALRLFDTSQSHAWDILARALEPVLCGLLVMWFTQNPSHSALLRRAPIQWLGACSYGIYLWQQLFSAPSTEYHRVYFARQPFGILGILFFAALSHYLIERPCVRIGRTISDGVRKAKPIGAELTAAKAGS